MFAEKALDLHIAATGAAVTSVAYRGYGTNGLPVNLPNSVAAEKQHFLATYAGHDPGAGLTVRPAPGPAGLRPISRPEYPVVPPG